MLLSVSTLSAILITNFISREARVALRPVTQPALTVVGMMFSILVGFFIAQSMRDYSTASQNVVQEANAVASVFRLSRAFDDVNRKRIRGLCRDYANTVLDEEWALLSEGKESEKAWGINQLLWEACLSVTPKNDREAVACSSMLNAMERFGEYRRARMGTITHGLSLHLWFFIAIGASAIVSITFMFAPENKRFHAGILACIVIPLTVNAYILSECSHPFSGAVSIQPSMFQLLRDRTFQTPDTPPRWLNASGGDHSKLAQDKIDGSGDNKAESSTNSSH